MIFFDGFLFGFILSLISIIAPTSADDDQSNEIACSVVKCSLDTVCQVVQGRAQCVTKTDHESAALCHLPAETGRCRGYIESYFYNVTTGECEKFVYGGCKGNDNRFQTIELCEKACKTDEKDKSSSAKNETVVKDGHCPVIEKATSSSESCEHSCSSDADCTDDEKCCTNDCDYLCTKPVVKQELIAGDICQLKLDIGPCHDFVTRWHFDVGECKKFSFGGCEGNENNFATKNECQKRCAGISPECPDIANIPSPFGCEVVYYTKSDGCQGFQFRCHGGACAQDPCQNLCEYCINVPQPCPHPPCPEFTCLTNETCTVSAAKSGFYVESTHLRISQESIQSINAPQPDLETQRICHLPSETGRCRGFMKRWYYKGHECEEFVYGGCKGNENNFNTKEECGQKCSGVLPCPSDEAGKAPTGCQWVYSRKADGCQESLLNCTEGPCAEKPCKGECEYCINEPKACLKEPCPQFVCAKNKTCQGQPKPEFDSANEVCNLPPVTGKCRGAFTRWYYNETSAACATFLYGGCGGNENRFDNEEMCNNMCKKEKPSIISDVTDVNMENEICILPPVTGKCRGAFTRWYYNETSATCSTFMYGGCGGNENRFENEEMCSNMCKKESPAIISDPNAILRQCHMPVFPGPCTTFITRWFYDGTSCKQFTYGGCEGNENSFATVEDCEKRCSDVPACPPLVVPQPISPGCVLTPETKPDGCQTLTVSCPAAGCANNPCKGECEMCVNDEKHCAHAPCPQYKCEKNQTCLTFNDDKKLNEICLLPAKIGNCRAAFPRYFFNETSDECEKFIYGGCKGNENRFETIEECKNTCHSNIGTKRIRILNGDKYRICRLSSQAGDCTDSSKRWFYEFGECREFTFNGCNGNENNFKTQNECASFCNGVKPCPVFDAPEPVEGCELVTYLTPDHCSRFHFKCTKGACSTKPCSSDCENCINEPKICKQQPCSQYRCERNETCVQDVCTAHECSAGYTCDSTNGKPTCVKRSSESSCNSNLSIGTCRGRYESYYYDTSTGTCKSFTYTGCEGNANRFGSLKTCQDICLH